MAAAAKPMWRDAWARSRCLVPAEGWYEWQALERVDPATGEIRKAKEPHFIRRKDGALLCFAGLASWWKNPQTGEHPQPYTTITVDDVTKMKWVPVFPNGQRGSGSASAGTAATTAPAERVGAEILAIAKT